ncbi:CBS domain-containing protein [Aquibacillus koreensis]|uniref:CBS domain-containing protein n=1 Tax=Aquibacillus koreensis TaxID=279446 RepID=A0A9X4AID1_9BACI|nr:CBS domain-containing protein [Aquibacillus koreensis]MCT2538086.1 CBS domain-containing protein [Aquibacillus koreensis]MDC3420609.1 CBS domain-containing protein [Aquibacillus koreensis]
MKSVKEVMSSNLVHCTADDTIVEAATKMKNNNIGVIPVCGSNQDILGMVTDRDLVIRGYANKKDGSSKVQEVMSDQLVSVSSDTTVQEASDLMAEHQIRRLPVVDSGKLVGIIALGDLALEDQSNRAAGHALEEISERPEVH